MKDTVKIYVKLLEEGSETARGTQAIVLGNGLYQLLPTPKYDPEDEIWEFLPNTIIKAKHITDDKDNVILLATEQVE